MNETEMRIIGVLECLDEAGNVMLGIDGRIPLAGNPHATVSQRLGQMLLFGTPRQKRVARFCDVILTCISVNIFKVPTKSHCLDAIANFPTDLPRNG